MTQCRLSGVCWVTLCVCGVGLFLGGCTEPVQSKAGDISNLTQAESDFAAQRDRPPSAKTLYAMADILATQGRDKECELVLRRCIQQYPRFVPAYNSLAELEMRRGRSKEASEVLAQAVEIRPREPVLLNNLGMSYLVQKEYEKALEYFTKAASLAPKNRKYRANVATALGLLGHHDESAGLLLELLPEEEAQHNAEVLREAHEKVVELEADGADQRKLRE